jgi:hypothetical protein
MAHQIVVDDIIVSDSGINRWLLEQIGVVVTSYGVTDFALSGYVAKTKGNPDGLALRHKLVFPETAEYVRHPKDAEQRKNRRDAMGSILVYSGEGRHLVRFRRTHGLTPGVLQSIEKIGEVDNAVS